MPPVPGPHSPGQTGQRRDAGELGHRDPVGDLHGAAVEVLDLHLAGQRADRDPGGDPLQHELEQPLRRRQRPGAGHRGVEGGHHRARGRRAPPASTGSASAARARAARRSRRGRSSAAPGRWRPARRRPAPPSRCTAAAPPARPLSRTAAAASPRRPGRARSPRARARSAPRRGRRRGSAPRRARRTSTGTRCRCALRPFPQFDSGGGSSHTRCSMCQSCGCRRCPRQDGRRPAGSAAGPARRAGRPRGRAAPAGPPAARRRSPARTRARRRRAARRCAAPASPGRRGIRVRPPKNSTSTPAGGEVPVGQQRHDVPLAEPLGEHVEGGARPAVGGQDLHAQALPEGHEPLEERLGLEPFGDGDHRPAVRGDPGAGERPSCRVRQRHDHARGRRRSADSSSACPSSRKSVSNCSRLRPGSRNASQPVAGVGAHAGADQLVELGLGLPRADDPAQVVAQPPYAGAVPAVRAVGAGAEERPRRPARAGPGPAASRRRSRVRRGSTRLPVPLAAHCPASAALA